MNGSSTKTPEALLQDIMSDVELNHSQKINSVLQLGLEVFQMEFGIVSQICTREYEVLYCQPAGAGIEPGATFDLGVTYCNITVKFPVPVAIANAAASEYNRHPCREVFKLESYIGARLNYHRVDYGTINFSSTQARGLFTADERQLIRVMADAVDGLLHS